MHEWFGGLNHTYGKVHIQDMCMIFHQRREPLLQLRQLPRFVAAVQSAHRSRGRYHLDDQDNRLQTASALAAPEAAEEPREHLVV